MMIIVIAHQSFKAADVIKNFPFTSQRNNQAKVLNDICNAFNSCHKYIILEAPTGFGKSPVAIGLEQLRS
jgi:superfamily II DNA or RNA helicase